MLSLQAGAEAVQMSLFIAVLAIPFRVVRAPLGLVSAISHSWDRRTCYTIAVAGLDESKAQPLAYTLRRAASTDEVSVGCRWGLPTAPPPCRRRRRHAATAVPLARRLPASCC